MGGVASRLAGCWRRNRRVAQGNAELEELDREEEALKGTVHELKDELEQASKRHRSKLEEIRELTRRLHELKNGNGKETKIVIKKQKRIGAESKGDPEEQPRMKIPEEVFPEEVWRMIIGNVSDPRDLWNLCNTCQLFDNILSKWKTGWLLGQALPYLYKDLPANKLLECRTVCRSWKAAVDDFLGGHSSARPHDLDKIDPRRLDFVNPVKEKLLTDGRDLLSAYDFTSYLQKPEPGPKPFIGRFVEMFLEAGRQAEDYEGLLDEARDYLTRFGKDVWDLEVMLPGPREVTDESLHSSFIRLITVDLFRLVPNLRRLDMTYMHPTHVGFGNPGEIELGSIPDAPQLDTFLGHNTDHDDALSEALLSRFHSQLRKLCLTVHTWNLVRHLNWNNLAELQLTYIRDLEDLMSLRGVWMPRLSKLRLDLRRLNHDRITFDDLLECIRELCQTTTLNTIRLDGGLDALRIEQVVRNEDVTPAITTLEIDHNWGEDEIPSYSFLLSFFPLIENLHLFVREYSSDDGYSPEIDFLPHEKCESLAKEYGFQEVFEIVEVNKYVYRRQMYRSNIWELLPRLKVFSFQWDVYTRHGYEEYLEKKERLILPAI